MDDTLRVCGVESIGDLDTQIEHRFDLQRHASNAMPECLPLQQFHGDEGSSIDLIDFVDGADVRVIKRRCCLGFPLKAAEGLRIVRKFVGKKFQGDVATELQIFRLIHHAHATAAYLQQDAVMGHCLPHGLGWGGHWQAMLGGGEGEVKRQSFC